MNTPRVENLVNFTYLFISIFIYTILTLVLFNKYLGFLFEEISKQCLIESDKLLFVSRKIGR